MPDPALTESSDPVGYHYWHDKVAKGPEAVPVVDPPLLEKAVVPEARKIKAIEKYSFLDDGDFVKIYVPLEGDLDGAKSEGVQSNFDTTAMHVLVEGTSFTHRLQVDNLAHAIRPHESKTKITKSGKLIISLKKAPGFVAGRPSKSMDQWDQLRGTEKPAHMFRQAS